MRTIKEPLILLLSILDLTSVVCVTNCEKFQILFKKGSKTNGKKANVLLKRFRVNYTMHLILSS